MFVLNTLISKEPRNVQAYRLRSRVQRVLENYAEAIQDSNKAIALDPKFADEYANRAGSYTEMQQYEKAMADSNQAIALNPKLAGAYSARALIYEYLGQYQKDIEDLNKAIALDRSSFTDYVHRGFAFRNLGQYQRALQDFDKALSLAPGEAACYLERGYTHLRIGNDKQAMEDFAMVAKVAPQSFYGYSLRADAYGELGQYQKQIDELTLCAKISPKVANVYEKRADAYYKLFQLENAISDCTTAIKLDPTSANAYSIAAAAYDDLGLYSKSVDHRTLLLRLKTGNAMFDWYNRGQDYERLGKPDLSKADWQRAIALASPSQRDVIKKEKPLVEFNNLTSSSDYKEAIDKQLNGKSVVLQFHYDQGGHICVPLTVNGVVSEFMLDSGCSHTQICEKGLWVIAQKTNLNMLDLRAPGSKYLNEFFSAKSLKLDNLVLANVSLGVCHDLYKNTILGGYLGGNILENFVVSLNYKKKQVTLTTTPQRKPSNRAIVVPMIIRDHRPYCSVRLDGKLSLWALLDTGCPFSMAADALLQPIVPQKLTFNAGISGPQLGNLHSEGVQLTSLELGAAKLKSPIFEVFPAAESPKVASTITLGNDFFSGFSTVTFDYPGRRVIFEPEESVSLSAPQLIGYGRFYLEHNQPKPALEALTKSMILDKEFAQACFPYRAKAFEHLKQYQKAIQDLSAQLELDHENPWIFINRARNYRMLAKYKLEIADDSTAIYLEPKLKSAYLDRAWAFDKLGMHELAEKDRQTAKKLPSQ